MKIPAFKGLREPRRVATNAPLCNTLPSKNQWKSRHLKPLIPIPIKKFFGTQRDKYFMVIHNFIWPRINKYHSPSCSALLLITSEHEIRRITTQNLLLQQIKYDAAVGLLIPMCVLVSISNVGISYHVKKMVRKIFSYGFYQLILKQFLSYLLLKYRKIIYLSWAVKSHLYITIYYKQLQLLPYRKANIHYAHYVL